MSSAQSNIAQDESLSLVQAYERFADLSYLRPDEIREASRIVRKLHEGLDVQFIEVTPLDLPKSSLIAAVQDNRSLERQVQVVCQCVATNETFVDTLSMRMEPQLHCEVIRSQTLTDVQPSILRPEYKLVNELCRAYEPLRQAFFKRGLNPDFVVADSWCSPEYLPSDRICWAALYYHDPSEDFLPYARPLDGLSMRVSLTKKAVVFYDDSRFDDFPIPTSDTQSKLYPPEKQRKDMKPIMVTQPEGPSFRVERDTHVYWQKWSMQVGFTGREGLVLSGICYEGRPIMHRLSMVEMVVPYGDTRAPQTWKNAFDAGEDGLGYNANSLVLGCDCLGLIHYFDGHIVDEAGEPYTITRAICMHEEDASIGWKHTDWRTNTPHVARSRRLVVSFICTIANYEYGFYFHFYLNGNIEVDVKLTGVLNTGAMSLEDLAAGGRKYGTRLNRNLYAAVHQHFFVARMDFAVDGVRNNVYEWNVAVEDYDDTENNPFTNGFYYEQNLLKSESEAKRHPCADTSRFWQVGNPNVKNSIGSMVSYRFHPQTTIRPYANLDRAVFLKRAKFLQHQLWVTPWQQFERYPAGDFPNQSQIVGGLPAWTAQNRSLVEEDLVVWHVFGVTHLPRPEEWPIMPAEHCGFKLTPFGFFDHSPAMDVPNIRHKSHYTTNSAGQITPKVPGSCCGGASKASSQVVQEVDGMDSETDASSTGDDDSSCCPRLPRPPGDRRRLGMGSKTPPDGRECRSDSGATDDLHHAALSKLTMSTIPEDTA